MNKSMKSILAIFSFTLLLILAIPVQAQPPEPGDGGGGPAGVPIDGGISLLLAAGVAYGGKKYHEMKKQNDEEV